LLWKKYKINRVWKVNKVVVYTLWKLWKWMIKSYVPDDVLEETSAARYQMLAKKLNYVIRKNWKNLLVNENQ
jgi:hypothetical protein